MRRPPRYVAARAAQELRRQGERPRIWLARHQRGPLSREHILPAGSSALERTRRNLRALAPWSESVEAVRDDPILRSAAVERTARVLAHRFELFGDAPIELGSPPAWSEDARSGCAWPLRYYRAIDYRNLGRPSDVKVAWELSRLRHCVALAQGVVVAGDQAALTALEAHLLDWHANNPLGWSVNWTCAMEVALRAVNLICTDAILTAADISYRLRPLVVESLYQHGWFLVRNLEVSDVNGNHFLGDAVGLLWLGRYFEGMGDAPRWFERGRAMVAEAAREQILPDGLDVEGSLPYHVLVLELFLTARVAAGEALRGCDDRLASMLDAACSFVGPDGRVPNIGDDDGGRVLAFCDAPSRDARRVLALGAAVLDHGWAAEVAAGGRWDDAIWLVGPERATRARGQARRRARLRRFDSGGLVVLGEGSDRVVVDAGPVGFYGRGGHGHLDAMSFEAIVGGRLAVRDSGTGTYTRDPSLRERLRDAPAHNLVIVDGLAYARLKGPEDLWSIEGDAPPTILRLETGEEEQLAELLQEIPAARGTAAFVRRILWRPGTLVWADEVTAATGAEVQHFVHLPPEAEQETGGFLSPHFAYEVKAPAGAEVRLERAPWSERYDSVGTGKRAVVSYRSSGDAATVSWSARSRT